MEEQRLPGGKTWGAVRGEPVGDREAEALQASFWLHPDRSGYRRGPV